MTMSRIVGLMKTLAIKFALIKAHVSNFLQVANGAGKSLKIVTQGPMGKLIQANCWIFNILNEWPALQLHCAIEIYKNQKASASSDTPGQI